MKQANILRNAAKTAALLAVLTFAACGGKGGNAGGSTPEAKVKSFYTEIQNGNFEKAAEILLKNDETYLWETVVEKKEIPAEMIAFGISHYAGEIQKKFSNGVKSFEIIPSEVKSESLRFFEIKYIDNSGKERTDYIDAKRYTDSELTGTWYLEHSINK
jgi:hypothetical protein